MCLDEVLGQVLYLPLRTASNPPSLRRARDYPPEPLIDSGKQALYDTSTDLAQAKEKS